MKLLGIGVCVIGFWIAALLDAAGSQGAGFAGSRPQLVLMVALAVALCSRPGVGALAGFVGALVVAGMVGSNLLSLGVVMTLVGFGFGWVGRSDLEVSLPIGAGVIALGTLAIGLAVTFLSPPSDIAGALRATILSAVYNGVLAVPFYALLRRLFLDKEI
jgi:rod shape-determining protein MreD